MLRLGFEMGNDQGSQELSTVAAEGRNRPSRCGTRY